MNGQFRPLQISRGIRQAFQENSQELGMANPFDAASSYVNNIFSILQGLPLLMNNLPEIPNIFKEAREMYPGQTYEKYMESNVPGVTPNIVGGTTQQSSGLDVRKTQAEGQRVFGPFDTIFGG